MPDLEKYSLGLSRVLLWDTARLYNKFFGVEKGVNRVTR